VKLFLVLCIWSLFLKSHLPFLYQWRFDIETNNKKTQDSPLQFQTKQEIAVQQADAKATVSRPHGQQKNPDWRSGKSAPRASLSQTFLFPIFGGVK